MDRRIARLAIAVVTIIAAVVASPLVAWAKWSASGSGSAGAAATTMPIGATPTASVRLNSVQVQWTAVTLGSGAPVQGYDIRRYNAANGSQATVGAGCAGIITGTSCIEQSVPSGTWFYTDTPVQASWTGGTSSPSSSVTTP